MEGLAFFCRKSLALRAVVESYWIWQAEEKQEWTWGLGVSEWLQEQGLMTPKPRVFAFHLKYRKSQFKPERLKIEAVLTHLLLWEAGCPLRNHWAKLSEPQSTAVIKTRAESCNRNQTRDIHKGLRVQYLLSSFIHQLICLLQQSQEDMKRLLQIGKDIYMYEWALCVCVCDVFTQ